MRRAKPHELKTHAVPIMTARMSEAELGRWFPVRFEEISDPLEAAEPSKAALVQLEGGAFVVLYYGKESKQLIVEIPESTKDSSALLAAFFEEVPVPLSRVLWHRPDAEVPKRRGSTGLRSVDRTAQSKTTSTTRVSRARAKRSAMSVSASEKRK